MRNNKFIALILALVMAVSVCSVAYAAEEEEYKNAIGDVDGNGKCDMLDVVATQRYIAKLKDFDENQLKFADVDKEFGKVDMVDVVCMQKYIAKLIDMFPAASENKDSDTPAASDTDAKTSDSDTKTSDADSDKLTTDTDSEEDPLIIIIDDETDSDTPSTDTDDHSSDSDKPSSDTDNIVPSSDDDSDDDKNWSDLYKP